MNLDDVSPMFISRKYCPGAIQCSFIPNDSVKIPKGMIEEGREEAISAKTIKHFHGKIDLAFRAECVKIAKADDQYKQKTAIKFLIAPMIIASEHVSVMYGLSRFNSELRRKKISREMMILVALFFF